MLPHPLDPAPLLQSAVRSAGALERKTAPVPMAGLVALRAALRSLRTCAGMDDYLAKPITPERLAAVVERWADSA